MRGTFCVSVVYLIRRGVMGTCVNIDVSEIRVVVHKREPKLKLVKSFSLNPAEENLVAIC
jgi:hypothetical protein